MMEHVVVGKLGFSDSCYILPMTLLLNIIGAGHLGARVADLWARRSVDSRVLAETNSSPAGGLLLDDYIVHRFRTDPDPRPSSYVLFSVPPSSVQEYRDEAARAVRLWNGGGRLLMTSSTGVYGEANGGVCIEESPLSSSERARILLGAEEVVLEAGGSVVRMAGLYDRGRGVHRYYQKMTRSDQRADGLVNLIHYDDAARLCVAALLGGEPGRVYMGCDDRPMTRGDLVQASMEAGLFGRNEACEFAGGDGAVGRRCDSSSTRQSLDWTPVYKSFVDGLT